MSLSVDVLSIILFVTLSQGFFILSILLIKDKRSQYSPFFLFFMVLALMWFQAEFLSVRLPYDIPITSFYGTRFGAWLLLGPLFYFYVTSIVRPPIIYTMLDGLHFAPFILFVWIIPSVMPEFLSFRQVHYGMLSTFDSFNDNVTFIQYLYSAVFVLQFIHLLFYLFISYGTVRRYETNLAENYSSLNLANITWLKTVNILLFVILVLVTLFLALFFLKRSYNRDLDYLYVFPMTVLTYLIGYKLAGVKWPAAIVPSPKNTKYEKSSLKPDQAKTYSRELEQLISTVKPFLNNELRLQELAEMLNIPPHHLSQVINEQLQTTFFDYINLHRVEEAKRLIKADKNATLLEIAFKSGFNNKTSFTNAFKKFTSQTPLEFKKKAGNS
jgi:AraC-like DNA-binding protein